MTDTFDGFWIDVVREKAAELGATAMSVTWPTLDGEVTVDYRVDDWLRVKFSGDAPERTYVLSPDWSQT